MEGLVRGLLIYLRRCEVVISYSTFDILPSLVKKIFNIYYRAEAPRYKAIKPDCGQLQKMVIKQKVNEKHCTTSAMIYF